MLVHKIYIAFPSVPGLNLALCRETLLAVIFGAIECIAIRSHIRLL